MQTALTKEMSALVLPLILLSLTYHQNNSKHVKYNYPLDNKTMVLQQGEELLNL